MSEQYRLKLKAASMAFGIGYQQLWQAVKEERVPALRVGRQWFVRPEDIEAYMQSVGEPNARERERIEAAV